MGPKNPGVGLSPNPDVRSMLAWCCVLLQRFMVCNLRYESAARCARAALGALGGLRGPAPSPPHADFSPRLAVAQDLICRTFGALLSQNRICISFNINIRCCFDSLLLGVWFRWMQAWEMQCFAYNLLGPSGHRGHCLSLQSRRLLCRSSPPCPDSRRSVVAAWLR